MNWLFAKAAVTFCVWASSMEGQAVISYLPFVPNQTWDPNVSKAIVLLPNEIGIAAREKANVRKDTRPNGCLSLDSGVKLFPAPQTAYDSFGLASD
jgi:hypothetical protein